MSSVRRGNWGELRVQAALEDAGYLVAQRRHVGGAGDLLAHPPAPKKFSDPVLCLLVEVKTDKTSPFANFRKADRQSLVETAQEYGCEPLLAWTPFPSIITYLTPDEFPNHKEEPHS